MSICQRGAEAGEKDTNSMQELEQPAYTERNYVEMSTRAEWEMKLESERATQIMPTQGVGAAGYGLVTQPLCHGYIFLPLHHG